MNIPKKLLYTKDHEWIRIEDGIATIGVTDYAQNELGDIVFIELPDEGARFQAGDSISTIEAVKTVADIFTPMDGEISKINKTLENKPELINNDPYESGWIVKLCNFSINDSNFLSASEYNNLIK